MRSLVSLLAGAVRRGASEVVLESGQPVVYTTARGAEAESNVLPRTELFDMLLAAVDDAHQVELAVGNPVEFEIAADGSWTVYAEPGQDGITVQARRPVAPGLEIDLEYQAAGSGVGFGFEVEEPQFDVGLDAIPVRRPRPPSEAPPSQLHVEALDVPAVDDSGAISIGPESTAPFESGTWALDDDDDLDVGFDDADEDSLPTGFGARAPSGPHIGVPDDDDDETFDPFSDVAVPPEPGERRLTHSPTVRAMEASPQAQRPTPPDDSVPQRRARDISDRVTKRDLGVVGSSDTETHRDLPSVDSKSPVQHGLIADVPEGTLVFVREPGLADTLARASQAPSITIDDPHDPQEVWSRVRSLPPGAIIIVRCEDPSTLLDGVLRRLEEGYRVFVETRARTVEGARRVLLGVSATERAERWLSAQATLTVEPGEGGPQLVKA